MTIDSAPYKKYIKKIDKKTGRGLRIYSSIEEAYSDIEKPISASVSRVCDGEKKTAFGFRWSWCVIPTSPVGGSSEGGCINCEKGNVIYEDECDRCILNKHYYTIYREFERQQDPLEKIESNIRNRQKMCMDFELNCRAKKDGGSFDFSSDFCKKMMKDRCFYCGFSSKTNIFNSIVRKDDSKPYSLENIVSCCKVCSRSKNLLDSSTFITRMLHISKIFFDIGEEDPQVWSDSHSPSNFQTCKDKAHSQSIEWSLTEKIFDKICSSPCHYCLKSPIDTNSVGRFLGGTTGYTEENCIACCSKCGTLRGDLDYGDFLNLAWSIAVNMKHRRILTNVLAN